MNQQSSFLGSVAGSNTAKIPPKPVSSIDSGRGRGRALVSLPPTRGGRPVTASKAPNKLAAPKPLQLPSLRSKHSGFDPNVPLVPKDSSRGWGGNDESHEARERTDKASVTTNDQESDIKSLEGFSKGKVWGQSSSMTTDSSSQPARMNREFPCLGDGSSDQRGNVQIRPSRSGPESVFDATERRAAEQKETPPANSPVAPGPSTPVVRLETGFDWAEVAEEEEKRQSQSSSNEQVKESQKLPRSEQSAFSSPFSWADEAEKQVPIAHCDLPPSPPPSPPHEHTPTPHHLEHRPPRHTTGMHHQSHSVQQYPHHGGGRFDHDSRDSRAGFQDQRHNQRRSSPWRPGGAHGAGQEPRTVTSPRRRGSFGYTSPPPLSSGRTSSPWHHEPGARPASGPHSLRSRVGSPSWQNQDEVRERVGSPVESHPHHHLPHNHLSSHHQEPPLLHSEPPAHLAQEIRELAHEKPVHSISTQDPAVVEAELKKQEDFMKEAAKRRAEIRRAEMEKEDELRKERAHQKLLELEARMSAEKPAQPSQHATSHTRPAPSSPRRLWSPSSSQPKHTPISPVTRPGDGSQIAHPVLLSRGQTLEAAVSKGSLEAQTSAGQTQQDKQGQQVQQLQQQQTAQPPLLIQAEKGSKLLAGNKPQPPQPLLPVSSSSPGPILDIPSDQQPKSRPLLPLAPQDHRPSLLPLQQPEQKSPVPAVILPSTPQNTTPEPKRGSGLLPLPLPPPPPPNPLIPTMPLVSPPLSTSPIVSHAKRTALLPTPKAPLVITPALVSVPAQSMQVGTQPSGRLCEQRGKSREDKSAHQHRGREQAEGGADPKQARQPSADSNQSGKDKQRSRRGRRKPTQPDSGTGVLELPPPRDKRIRGRGAKQPSLGVLGTRAEEDVVDGSASVQSSDGELRRGRRRGKGRKRGGDPGKGEDEGVSATDETLTEGTESESSVSHRAAGVAVVRRQFGVEHGQPGAKDFTKVLSKKEKKDLKRLEEEERQKAEKRRQDEAIYAKAHKGKAGPLLPNPITNPTATPSTTPPKQVSPESKSHALPDISTAPPLVAAAAGVASPQRPSPTAKSGANPAFSPPSMVLGDHNEAERVLGQILTPSTASTEKSRRTGKGNAVGDKRSSRSTGQKATSCQDEDLWNTGSVSQSTPSPPRQQQPLLERPEQNEQGSLTVPSSQSAEARPACEPENEEQSVKKKVGLIGSKLSSESSEFVPKSSSAFAPSVPMAVRREPPVQPYAPRAPYLRTSPLAAQPTAQGAWGPASVYPGPEPYAFSANPYPYANNMFVVPTLYEYGIQHRKEDQMEPTPFVSAASPYAMPAAQYAPFGPVAPQSMMVGPAPHPRVNARVPKTQYNGVGNMQTSPRGEYMAKPPQFGLDYRSPYFQPPAQPADGLFGGFQRAIGPGPETSSSMRFHRAFNEESRRQQLQRQAGYGHNTSIASSTYNAPISESQRQSASDRSPNEAATSDCTGEGASS